MAKLNPSITHNQVESGGVQPIFTDDVSLKVRGAGGEEGARGGAGIGMAVVCVGVWVVFEDLEIGSLKRKQPCNAPPPPFPPPPPLASLRHYVITHDQNLFRPRP